MQMKGSTLFIQYRMGPVSKVFVGKSRIEAVANMAISDFIEDIFAMLVVMQKLWLQSTLVILNAMRNNDMTRISKANIVLSANAYSRHNSLSQPKRSKGSDRGDGRGPHIVLAWTCRLCE